MSVACIDKEYLHSLVTEGAQETISLDFKREMYALKKTPDQKAEMLRDISAMANSEGGDILIGIEEEKKGNIWVAKSVVGIEEASQQRLTIEQACAIHLSPRIASLRVHPVDIGDGRAVLVVRVPPSIHAPHAVTFQNEDRFWMRTGAEHKRHATADEVRRLCLREWELYPSSRKRLEAVLDRARRGIIPVGGMHRLNLVAVPIPPRDGLVDVAREEIKQALVTAWPDIGPVGRVRPTSEGLWAPLGGADKPCYHAQIKRDGAVLWAGLESLGITTPLTSQYAATYKRAEDLDGEAVLRIVKSFLGFIRTLWELIDHGGPSLITVALSNLGNIGLSTGLRGHGFPPPRTLKALDVNLELPTGFGIGDVLKDVADRIWNVWHQDSCSLVSADGKCSWENDSGT